MKAITTMHLKITHKKIKGMTPSGHACCLTTPSHYLNHCGLIIMKLITTMHLKITHNKSKARPQWTCLLPDCTKPLPESLRTYHNESNHYNAFEDYTLKIKATSPRGQWVNPCLSTCVFFCLQVLIHVGPRSSMASFALAVNLSSCHQSSTKRSTSRRNYWSGDIIVRSSWCCCQNF